MTDEELLELAVRMRAAQRHYFAMRREGGPHIKALEVSKALEREFDKAAAERFSPQGTLI